MKNKKSVYFAIGLLLLPLGVSAEDPDTRDARRDEVAERTGWTSRDRQWEDGRGSYHPNNSGQQVHPGGRNHDWDNQSSRGPKRNHPNGMSPRYPGPITMGRDSNYGAHDGPWRNNLGSIDDHRDYGGRRDSVTDGRYPNRALERGIESGRLSNDEARDLEQEREDLRKKEREYLADGRLSNGEREELQKKEREYNGELQHQLTDDERRR